MYCILLNSFAGEPHTNDAAPARKSDAVMQEKIAALVPQNSTHL
jgi:hypothetical protein